MNLYTDAAKSYVGAKDTGAGVGFDPESPLLPTWIQGGVTPNGWFDGVYMFPTNCWVHGAKIYFTAPMTGGLGRGVIEYDLATNPVSMSYSDFAALAGMLEVTDFPSKYGSMYAHDVIYSGDRVYVLGLKQVNGSGYQTLGCWDPASFPFTAANAIWISPLQHSYGTGGYVEGQVQFPGYIIEGASYLYVVSARIGQVHTIDKATGAVVGAWAYYTGVQANCAHRFTILGEYDGKVVGGGIHADGGGNKIWLWDTSNPNLWTTVGDPVLPNVGLGGQGGPDYKQVASLYPESGENLTPALTPYEKSLLGFGADELVFFQTLGSGSNADQCLVYYNLTTGAHRILLIDDIVPKGPLNFVGINGIPWFVRMGFSTPEQYAENPTGYRFGLVAKPIGPGTVEYAFTATAAGTPTAITLHRGSSVSPEVVNPRRHRFRYKVGAGEFTGWVGGDDLVNLSLSWPGYAAGDDVTIQHQLASADVFGWADLEWKPDTVVVPKDVVATLLVDPDLPDAGKTLYPGPRGGPVIDIHPLGGRVQVVT